MLEIVGSSNKLLGINEWYWLVASWDLATLQASVGVNGLIQRDLGKLCL